MIIENFSLIFNFIVEPLFYILTFSTVIWSIKNLLENDY